MLTNGFKLKLQDDLHFVPPLSFVMTMDWQLWDVNFERWHSNCDVLYKGFLVAWFSKQSYTDLHTSKNQ